MTLNNLGLQSDDSRETDYYLGQTRSEESKGPVGAKVRLITPPTGGNRITLCAAVT